MKNFRHAIIVAAALTIGQTVPAGAAGLLPPPIIEPVPIPEPVAAWDYYFRAYIGITSQKIDTFTNEVIEAGDFTIIDHDFDSSPFLGLGIGYVISDKFRVDLTGEYRGKSNFQALDTYVDVFCPTGVCTNEHTGIKSEWLYLANAYWDIVTFRGFTPYVGAGIGAAAVTLDGFKDVNLVNNGLYWAQENTQWNLAWALHTGFSYEIAPNLALDVGYRFTYLGDGKTGSYYTYDPAAPQGLPPVTLKDITSHDVHIGLRWALGGNDNCCYAPDPIPVPFK